VLGEISVVAGEARDESVETNVGLNFGDVSGEESRMQGTTSSHKKLDGNKTRFFSEIDF
jgi:hypothetical protein